MKHPFPLFGFLLATVSLSSPSAAQELPSEPYFPGLKLAKAARGSAILGALGKSLPEVARQYRMTEQELGKLCLTDRDLAVDTSGKLLYVCEGSVAEAPTAQKAATEALLSYPKEQTFVLHSKPGTSRVLYLDFNGHTTSGTSWKSGATFTSPAYDTDGNPASFSDAELANIQQIWKRVSEDFAPWDVDVATEEPPLESLRKSTTTDTAYGVRMVIGGSSYDWYGAGAGGVAYLNSFSWNSDTPAFVFPAQLGNGFPKYVAEAVSHEAGHTVSLSHDGVSGGSAYYEGHDNWAPIMGVGYYKTVTQFSRGEYTNANNTEDDTTKINGHIPRSADLAGSDILTAVPLSGTVIDVTGIIDSRSDADLYRINAGAGTISLTAGTAAPDANLDISLALYNGAGNLVASANPSTLGATLSAAVTGGTYYIAVDGAGAGTGITGYTDYGSLGQFILTGSVPAPAGLPPVAAISPSGPIRGVGPLTVSFNGSGSSDPEGSTLSFDWDFGDGGSSTEANPTHVYTAVGTYTASLVVTDATGLSASAAVTVTVLAPTSVVYVSGISMTKNVSNRRTSARATVTVRDAAGNLKPGVVVTGVWSGLTTGTSTGTTGSSGTVTLSSANVAASAVGTFTFTITGLSGTGLVYDASRNTVTSGSIVK
jgi:PKD repeat protein